MPKDDTTHPLSALPIVFAVREALGNENITRKMLRSPKLHAPWVGARAKKRSDPITGLRALIEAAPKGAFFSHTTAIYLWGMPLPSKETTRIALRMPHVSVPENQTRVRRNGIRTHRLKVRKDEVTSLYGLPVTSVARTWLDVSELLRFPDLLAVTDYIIRPENNLGCGLQELHKIHLAFHRKRGSRKRKQALELASENSESPMESILRAKLHQAGFPTPQVNVTIRTTQGRIFRADLLFSEVKLILEYQGQHHESRKQWQADESRREQLQESGYYVMHLFASDLSDWQRTVERIRCIYDERLASKL